MLRLYLDEDALDKNLVRALRARGLDAQTARDAGMIERTDREHLEYATVHGRVLYSFNRGHFFRLHGEFLADGRPRGGIVLATQQRYGVGEQTWRLLRLAAAKTAKEMRSRLEFLSDWGG